MTCGDGLEPLIGLAARCINVAIQMGLWAVLLLSLWGFMRYLKGAV